MRNLLSGWTELSDTFIFHNSLKMNYLFKLKLTLKLVLPLICSLLNVFLNKKIIFLHQKNDKFVLTSFVLNYV